MEQKIWISDEIIKVFQENILQLHDMTEFRHERRKGQLLGTGKLFFFYKKILVSKKETFINNKSGFISFLL